MMVWKQGEQVKLERDRCASTEAAAAAVKAAMEKETDTLWAVGRSLESDVESLRKHVAGYESAISSQRSQNTRLQDQLRAREMAPAPRTSSESD